MVVNSFKAFREQFKKNRPNLQLECYNPHYIGTNHNGNYGFFSMYHGQKEDIAGFLQADLNMAEDDQAIYEFLQNAVDCDATLFSTYYNEDSFFVLNNGSQFDEKGIISILNIGQSTKHDANSIGRLGVGFKLAHRLVGKQNGIDELLNDYKGPIVFSWNNFEQLKSFLSEDEISSSNEWNNSNAHLFKILITNFPVGVGESVYDLNYKPQILFSNEELEEMRHFVSTSLGDISGQSLQYNQGTITYLKLGKGKSERLDNCKVNLIDGIQYSMNLFHSLTNIIINGEQIERKKLIIENSIIKVGTEDFENIEPEYKDYDIQFSIGFPSIHDYCDEGLVELDKLIKSPNFYKYFPMGEEVNNYGIFVHCDSFSVQSNRRELNEGITNENLLPIIAEFICNKLADYKKKSSVTYNQLYVSLLLSNPVDNWVKEDFWPKIEDYIKENIPVEGGEYCDDNKKVKIKNVSTNIDLDSIGLGHIRWFAWDDETNKRICNEAYDSSKLDLYRWCINDIIENADAELLAQWLKQVSNSIYISFFKELADKEPTKKSLEIIKKLPIYEFEGERVSWNEINDLDNYIVLTDHIQPIVSVLNKLGYKCSKTSIKDHILGPHINNLVQSDKWLFDDIRDNRDLSILSAKDKLDLIDAIKEFESIGPESIKKLKLFKNLEGELKPLSEMVPYNSSYDSWMSPFVIDRNEYSPILDEFLVSSEKVFSELIEDHYTDIIEGGLSPIELYDAYAKVWSPKMTKAILDKYGVNDNTIAIVEKERTDESVKALIAALPAEFYELSTEIKYKKGDYIYRLIELVVSSSDENNKELLRKKLYLNEEPLSSFSIKNEVTITLDEKKYELFLSDILPESTQSAIFSSIAEQFSDIKGFREIFSSEKNNLRAIDDDLYTYLKNSPNTINPSQYAFFMLYSNSNNYNGFESRVRDCVKLTQDKDILAVIDFFYIKKWSILLKNNIKNYCSSSISSIVGKYLFSADYTLVEERAPMYIQEWCGSDSDKLSFLKEIGLFSCDGEEIKRRRKFKNNELEDWGSELKSKPIAFLNWVKTIAPVSGDKQIEVLRNLSSKRYVSIVKNVKDYLVAREWDDSLYLKWKSQESNSLCKTIKFISGQMPCRITFDGEIIAMDHDKEHPDFWYNDSILYINDEYASDVDTILNEVQKWNKSVITKEDIYAMFYIDRKEFEELLRQKEQLELENEQLLVEGHGEKRSRGKKSTEERINLNREARMAAYDYLSSLPEYDCSEWDPEECGLLVNCIKYQGEYIKVAVISSGAGTIHLHPFVFAELMEHPNNLLLNYVKGKIYRRSYKSLFEENPDVNIIFDTDIVNNPTVIAKIVNILRGSAKTCFAIANRDYSAYDEIQGFGLCEKKEGEFQNYSLNDTSIFDWEE